METEKRQEQTKRRRLFLIILIIVLLLAACFLLHVSCEKREVGNEEFLDKIVEMSDEEKQAEINRMVEAGMINIQYQSSAVFEGDVSVSFKVKNIEANHHPIEFIIFDEKDRTIYESGEIPPGYEMNSIKLEKSLEKGVHDCRIVIKYAIDGAVASSFPISIEVR